MTIIIIYLESKCTQDHQMEDKQPAQEKASSYDELIVMYENA